MKVFSGGRQFARLLKSSVLLNSAAGCRNFSSESWILAAPQAACLPWLHQLHDATFSSVRFPGHYTAKAHFSTESNNAEIAPTEAVKEFHEKILESVNTKRTMSPNAWLWSLIEKCESHKDIELLFDCLENIRRFVSAFFPESKLHLLVLLREFDTDEMIFGCSAFPISEFMIISIAISAGRLPRLVLEQGPLTLVCVLFD
ncbi:unnamed protein product [Linum tenue]|uniref:Uncharacterized protein n=1 Tax=Linum tenue TaxID=586396 RepID=A0AAV0P6T0_9ROSI|nr:unnamed protein product [Linum tenue]